MNNKNKISKEMKKLRKQYEKANVSKVAQEIGNYYYKSEHDEKALFKRVRKLEINNEITDNIVGAAIGSILTLTFVQAEGILEIIKSFFKDFKNIGIKKVLIFIIAALCAVFAIVLISTVSLQILSKVRLYLEKNNSRNNYLDEKEIEVIKNVIESKVLY